LLYEKLQTKLAIVSDILDGKTEYLEVEDNSHKVGDFNHADKPDKKRKSPPQPKVIETSNGEKKTVVSGMFQLTSYFSKRDMNADAPPQNFGSSNGFGPSNYNTPQNPRMAYP